MDFSFNSEQSLIAETAETFLSNVSSSSAVRDAMATLEGFDHTVWKQVIQEMGWALTHIPESHDGLGLGYVELCILFEKMGQRLFCGPFFSSVALGVNALLLMGTEQQKQEGLSAIAQEGRCYSLAYSAKTRNAGVEAIAAQYKLKDDGAILSGECHYVIDGHISDTLIVAARLEGSTGSESIALFLVPAQSQGVSREWTPTLDQTRKLARVTFEKTLVPSHSIMLNAGNAADAFNKLMALSNICLAAEQLGVADQSLQLTLEYIKERKQFGRAVGGFQAIKHKAADMMTKVEASRSAVYYAACIADQYFAAAEAGDELLEAASIAKAYACEAAFFNAGSAIQMHGGVGFTWEFDIHLYFKRAKAAQLSFGDSAWHKERLAKIVLGELQCN